jgi:hypothetical protein
MRQVKPAIVVVLRATAAQAFLGSAFRLTKHRGEAVGTPPFRAACFEDFFSGGRFRPFRCAPRLAGGSGSGTHARIA